MVLGTVGLGLYSFGALGLIWHLLATSVLIPTKIVWKISTGLLSNFKLIAPIAATAIALSGNTDVVLDKMGIPKNDKVRKLY